MSNEEKFGTTPDGWITGTELSFVVEGEKVKRRRKKKTPDEQTADSSGESFFQQLFCNVSKTAEKELNSR